MPILWRYLLRNYFQVFFLCVSAFISVLLVLRFQEIARFITSEASFTKIALFSLYQIPYILPIAIPISCLISSLLLFQKLSYHQEITALRTIGLSLQKMVIPILSSGFLLVLLNAMIAFELAPICRSKARLLIYETVTSNPLFILQKQSPVKLKNMYIDLRVSRGAKSAEDVIIALKNSSNNRLSLFSFKNLSLVDEELEGNTISYISSFDSKKEYGFDHLMIENQDHMKIKAIQLGQFMQHTNWLSHHDYLTLRMLLAKESLEAHPKMPKKILIEIAKRISIAFAAFTFTLIGTCLGLQIGRNQSKKKTLWAISLAAFFMLCFIIAKSMYPNALLAISLLLIPHPLIAWASYRQLKLVSKGIE
ncbi:MAG: LptF/LptG family permease [Candidatus Rhabdochlamydia sp.]